MATTNYKPSASRVYNPHTDGECPMCGNTDRAKVEDNGERAASADLTFLCVMRDSDSEDGICGGQWTPSDSWSEQQWERHEALHG